MEESAIQEGKLNVFVSYSRADTGFADELVAGLEHAGFETTIDRHSIAPGEDWRIRLGGLILAADTIVFILSPNSISSEICAWEIAESKKQSKRVIPIVWKSVEIAKAPSGLSTFNAISFDNGRMITGLHALTEALKSDLEWLRLHTKLAVRSEEWLRGGKGTEWLLRGRALAEAHAWLSSRPKNAPDPTKQQLNYIEASEAEEARLLDHERIHQKEKEEARLAGERADAARILARRTLMGIAVTSALAIISIGIGLFAYAQRHEALKQTASAKDARKLAEDAKEEAIEARNETFLTTSKFVSEFANAQTKLGDSVTGMLLALEALPNPGSDNKLEREKPYYSDAAASLIRSLRYEREIQVLQGHRSPINAVFALSKSSQAISTSWDGVIRIWDIEEGRIAQTFYQNSQSILAADVSADQKTLATVSADGSIGIWNLANATNNQWHIDGAGSTVVVKFNYDASQLILGLADGRITIVDCAQRRVLETINAHGGRIVDLYVSPDGKLLLTCGNDGKLKVWDFSARRVTNIITNPSGIVTRVAVLANAAGLGEGHLIIGGTSDGELKIWDAATGELKRELKGHAREISGIVELPGAAILSASYDGSLRLWDLSKGGEPIVFRGHLNGVSAIAGSGDGRHVYSGSLDTTLRVWKLPDLSSSKREARGPLSEDGEESGVPEWAKGGVRALSKPDSIKVFIEGATSALPRCFTLEQRRNYVLSPEPADWCLRKSKWPFDAMSFLERGRAHALQNRDAEADASFLKFRELMSSDSDEVDRVWSEIQLRRARFHLSNMEYDKAMSAFEQAFEKDPSAEKRNALDLGRAENGLAWKLLLERRDHEALGHANKAISLDPTRAAYLDTRGHALEKLGSEDEACSDFEAATDAGATHPYTFFAHGACRERAHDVQGAIASYKQALRMEIGDEYAENAVRKAKERLLEIDK